MKKINRNEKMTRYASIILMAFALLMAFSSLFLLAFNLSRGFDFTDEAFFILWANQPENIYVALTQFGFYTGFLLKVASGNLTGFRLIGLLILLVMNYIFLSVLYKYMNNGKREKLSIEKVYFLIVMSVMGCAAYYNRWAYLTPSYNWLALIAVLMVGTGLLMSVVEDGADSDEPQLYHKPWLGPVLIGAGGALSFIAKPTTAFLLACVSIAWFVWVSKNNNRLYQLLLAAIISVFFLLAHVIVFKESVGDYYVELIQSLEYIKLLGVGTYASYTELLYGALVDLIKVVFTSKNAVFIPLTIVLYYWLNKQSSIKNINKQLIISMYLVVCWLILWHQGYWTRHSIASGWLIMAALMFTIYYLQGASLSEDDSNAVRAKGISLILFLLFIGFAFSFGTSSGFVRKMSGGLIFIALVNVIISGLIEYREKLKIIKNTLLVLISLAIFVVVVDSYKYPFRINGSIRDQIEPVSLHGLEGEIKVDKETAQYIGDIKKYSRESGWVRGTPLIDMTGVSPGVSIVMDARVIGTPWFLGGYSGSNNYALSVLAAANEGLVKKAWILTSDDGQKRLSEKVLLDLGMVFPENYEIVAELKVKHNRKVSHHKMWRPIQAGDI